MQPSSVGPTTPWHLSMAELGERIDFWQALLDDTALAQLFGEENLEREIVRLGRLRAVSARPLP
jgi:hypothetical protein